MKLINKQNLIIVDGHQDVVDWIETTNSNFFDKNSKGQVDYQKLMKGNIGLCFWSIFVDEEYKEKDPLFQTLYFLNKYLKILKKADKKFLLIEKKEQLEEVKKGEKLGVVLHLEGSDGVDSPSILEILYKLGIRSISLTWNYKNQHAGGSESSAGLTKIGKAIVRKANSLSILVDVSHLNEKSFWQVLKTSKDPVVATHSNVSSMCPSIRNLNDNQIRAIARGDGLIGINFVPKLLNIENSANINDVVRHIKYLAEIVGIDHVGIGSDLGTLKDLTKGLEDVTKIRFLAAKLRKCGFSNSEVEKVMGGNWLRVLRQILV